MTESYFTPNTEIKNLSTDDVRKAFRLTTDGEVNPTENGTAFDIWLDQVKAAAVAEATSEIRKTVLNEVTENLDNRADVAYNLSIESPSRYKDGRADGIRASATEVYRMI